jgi:hypothetical protein
MGRLDDPDYKFAAIARRMHPYATMHPEQLPPRPIIEEALFPPEGHVANTNLRDDTHFREFFRNLFEHTYTHPALWGGIDVVGFDREPHTGMNELTYFFYEVKGINVPVKRRNQRNTQFPVSAHQIVGPYGIRNNLRSLRHRPQLVGDNGTRAVLRHVYGGIVWMLGHHPERDRNEREYDIYVTMPVVAVGINGNNVKYRDKRNAERASVRDRCLERLLDEGKLIDVTHRTDEPRVRKLAISPRVHLPKFSTVEYRTMIIDQENKHYERLSAGDSADESWRNEGWSGDDLPVAPANSDAEDFEVPF